ncbi:MAG: flagellar basal body P-ring formation chaperone FlgA [Woeseiaceae bacterium]
MSESAPTIVGNLTAPANERHEFDGHRIAKACVVAIISLVAGYADASQQWQPIESITAAAEDFVRAKIGPKAARTAVKAGSLDSRHRLALCSKALEPFLRRGAKIDVRTIVGVRCPGEKPWKVYLPVEVIVTDKVLVAGRTLPRGHLLAISDLVVEERDVSRLLSGYFSDTKALVGQRLKAQLIAGRILTPAMVQADLAVKRGQTVTLTVETGGIRIQMRGKALMDGAIDQRIRVENTESGRVVEGIVRSQEHVEVLVAASGQIFHAKPKVSPSVADIRSSNNDR